MLSPLSSPSAAAALIEARIVEGLTHCKPVTEIAREIAAILAASRH